jgi:hypothetical protein
LRRGGAGRNSKDDRAEGVLALRSTCAAASQWRSVPPMTGLNGVMSTHEQVQKLMGAAKILCEATAALIASSQLLIEKAKRLVAEAEPASAEASRHHDHHVVGVADQPIDAQAIAEAPRSTAATD